MNYKLAYAIGFHPWEDAETDPPFAEKISEMLDCEESGREPPYGPALDLGTGQRDLGGGAGPARLEGHGCRHRREGGAARATA